MRSTHPSQPDVPYARCGDLVTPHGNGAPGRDDVEAATAAVEALEWERARMARVLHDGPVQELTAALLFLDGATQGGTGPDPALLRRGMETLQKAIRSCRRLMDQLTPGVQEPGELAARIEDLVVDRISATAAQEVHVDLPADFGAGQPEVLYSALRILEELIDNVARYAHGDLVAINISEQEGAVVVRVADGGRGGATVQPGGAASGLGVALQRAQSHGGELTIESGTDGTIVRVRLPVEGP